MPRVAYRSTNTTDPVLSRIQDAIDTAIRDLSTKQDRPELNREIVDGTRAYQATPGQIVETNSVAVSCLVSPPPVSADTVGQSFWVVRRSAAHTVTVGTDTLPAATGMWEFKQASTAWWRVGK